MDETRVPEASEETLLSQGQNALPVISSTTKNRNVKLTLVGNLIIRTAFATLMILLPIYLGSLHKTNPSLKLTGTEIGIIMSSYFFMQAILVIFLGKISDVLELRKPFLIIGTFLGGISFIVLGAANSFTTLVISRILQGTSSAFLTGSQLTFIGEMSENVNRGQNMSYYQITNYFGTGIGVFLGPLVYHALGEIEGNGRYAFHIFGGLLLLSFVFSILLHEETHNLEFKKRKLVIYLLQKTPFKGLLIAASILSILLVIPSYFPAIQTIFPHQRDYRELLLLSILIMIGIAFTALVLRNTFQKYAPYQFQSVTELLEQTPPVKVNSLGGILYSWFFIMTLLSMLLTYLPIFLQQGTLAQGSRELQEQSSVSVVNISMLYVLGALLLAISLVVFGKLIDYWGRYPIINMSLASLVIFNVLLFVFLEVVPIPFYNPRTIVDYLALLSIILLLFIASSYAPAALTIISELSQKDNRGYNNGFFVLLMGMGSLFGSLLGGIMWDMGKVYTPQKELLPFTLVAMIIAILSFLLQVKTQVSHKNSNNANKK